MKFNQGVFRIKSLDYLFQNKRFPRLINLLDVEPKASLKRIKPIDYLFKQNWLDKKVINVHMNHVTKPLNTEVDQHFYHMIISSHSPETDDLEEKIILDNKSMSRSFKL